MTHQHVVCVTGSRHYNGLLVQTRLSELADLPGGVQYVVHGDARGVDASAKAWCRVRGVHSIAVEALWDAYGKTAGPNRNAAMLSFCLLMKMNPAVRLSFLAFPGPNSRGTVDMMARIRREGYDCFVTPVPT